MTPTTPNTRRPSARAGTSTTIGLACLLTTILLAWLHSSTALAGLPDHRVYELVSTSGNVGEPYAPASYQNTSETGVLRAEHPFQAAENGEALAYVGEPPAKVGGSGETGPGLGNQWLAVRTPDGWSTTAITPQNKGEPQPFEDFSANLESGIFAGGRQPLVSGVPVGCDDLYSRETGSGAYHPVFLPTTGGECGRPLFAGSANDGADVIFQSEAALTEKNTEVASETPRSHQHNDIGFQFGEGCMYGCNLYESVHGELRAVNVVEGAPVPDAMFGGYPGRRGSGAADFSHVISTDGSRIFWTDTQTERIYVLEDGSTNVQVSGSGEAKYWTATPDGRYAYYTEAGGLWRFDTSDNTREAIAPEGSGAEAVIGTNETGEDSAYVYFVAGGALASGAGAKTCISFSTQKEKITKEQEEGMITGAEAIAARALVRAEQEEEEAGETPPKTGCNLYLRHDGVTHLLAVLAPEDNEIKVGAEGALGVGGDWRSGVGLRTAETTPDGRDLVFESHRSLTGYHNLPAETHQLQFEVFRYATSSETLTCASCDPTGAPPSVIEPVSEGSRLPVSTVSNTDLHRWISNDGSQIFFDSEQPLVAQDTNDVQDVYEWEAEGAASCPEATSTFGGCVFLLSGGGSSSYSFLVDADAAGNNVFFEHQGRMSSSEGDVAPDRMQVYDARVGGGFPSTVTSCAGASCGTEPQSPPTFETPGSIGFNGIENFSPQPVKPKTAAKVRAERLTKGLKACHQKHRKKRRIVCERQARRRYGPVHSKKKPTKATTNRRTQK